MATIDPTTAIPVEYREIPTFPGYRAGDNGSVWSCLKQVGLGIGNGSRFEIGSTWRRMRPGRHSGGRLHLNLSRDGRFHTVSVHRLILEAFIGPCPPGMEACHYDGDPTNNALSNLRWDTHEANLADKIRHGTTPRGENHRSAKLTEDQIRSIRRERSEHGTHHHILARRYYVSRSLIGAILSRKIWSHIE